DSFGNVLGGPGDNGDAVGEIYTFDRNQIPLADPQSVTTPEDMATGITLTGSDPDTDPITFVITSLPVDGTLSDDAVDITAVPHALSGALEYRPDADANGPDSFEFVANDGLSDSVPATVSI